MLTAFIAAGAIAGIHLGTPNNPGAIRPEMIQCA